MKIAAARKDKHMDFISVEDRQLEIAPEGRVSYRPPFHLAMIRQHLWLGFDLHQIFALRSVVPHHAEVVVLMFKLQVVRYRSKFSEHGRSGFRIASANERYRSRVAKYSPIALRSLYRRCWRGTFERFTSDQAVIGQVEWHGNKVCNLAHASSGTFL
jgi:hypothetical protein